MNTKFIMFSSAITMAISGIVLTFLPQETSKAIGWANDSVIVLQIIGALYFAFAMINWMSKSNLIGGIYNRPLAIGNFSHFFIGAMALLRLSDKNPTLLAVTIIYSLFATAFGFILFTHPVKKTEAE